MAQLSNIMLEILKFFYVIGGNNYGVAIILLTVATNIALYPLTLSSIIQMAAMQKVQPKLQALQKKYKDEPQKLQKEMMDLYKSEGVNPLGGCLPVLLKIPVFLALFFALQSPEFKTLIGNTSQFLWMGSIAKPDPTYIMPVLIGITMWLTQKSMPTTTGQNQMIMMLMPVFIVFVSVPFAAGVQLYWVVSNLIAWAQQVYIMSVKVPKGAK
jgi:YidC/Oxa1 family membrane protein insertase